jgi:hypothetical protein
MARDYCFNRESIGLEQMASILACNFSSPPFSSAVMRTMDIVDGSKILLVAGCYLQLRDSP